MEGLIIGLSIANIVTAVSVGITVAIQVRKFENKIEKIQNDILKNILDVKANTSFAADSIEGLNENIKKNIHKEITKLAFTPLIFK